MLIYLAWMFRGMLKKKKSPIETLPDVVAGPRELESKVADIHSRTISGGTVPSNNGMVGTTISITPEFKAVLTANELPYSPHAAEIDSSPLTQLYELPAKAASTEYNSLTTPSVSPMRTDITSTTSQTPLVDPPRAEFSQTELNNVQTVEALKAKHVQLEARRRTLLELQQIEEEQQAIQDRLARMGPSDP
jgi:hypothetical protein